MATRFLLRDANRQPIDAAVVLWFPGPASATGEDVAEFHVHGGRAVLAALFAALSRIENVRAAESGEFTRRAFENGKLDLTEAEGVAATIAAGNEQELQAARQLLAGELARRLKPAMELITQTLALIEVGIDFSEEDVTFLPIDEILRRFEQIDAELCELLDDSSRFEQLAHEPRIVLVGRPNAGKSTLMNALAGGPRAVVSSIAGTTRDVLTAGVDLPHGRVLLIDVAGIEPTSDPENKIENQMQHQAHRAIESADLIALVHDSTDSSPPLVLERPIDLVIHSKSDLDGSEDQKNSVSAKTGAGLSELRETLGRLAFERETVGVSLALNRRHIAAVEEARAAITRAVESTHDAAAELIALELREALDALGRILGSVTPDDILGRIFSTFCIGK